MLFMYLVVLALSVFLSISFTNLKAKFIKSFKIFKITAFCRYSVDLQIILHA